ncbi:MAG: lipopolysaccharide assembly protein LapB [Methylococcaceae bacterium]
MPTEFVIGLLCLLLPVAAASGWFAARKNNHKSSSYIDSVAPEYYRGLRYLINEQPDKAIEVFLKLLEVDGETVEVHLALGNLFRRRGEVDRAIRIHQNLIARPTLSNEQRSQALVELGVDYLRSGLLDRAEALFEDLLETPYKSRAARYLVEIYQDEKDWDKAIKCTRIWQQNSPKKLNNRIAHYYSQKAEELIEENNHTEAREFIKQALAEDPNSAHASIIKGTLEMEEGNYKKAIKAFKRLEKNSPELISEVLNPMKTCYRELGKSDKFLEYLNKLPTSQTGVNQIIELSGIIEDNKGTDDAISFLVDKIEELPSVRMLDRLVDLSLIEEQGQSRNKLECFKRLTEKLVQVKTAYKCHHCGYQARSLYWQCPGCKYWDTVKPIHGTVSEQL